MNRKNKIKLFGLVFFVSTWSFADTDKQIKEKIIRRSIASYSGNCPCPYNTDKRGYGCGRRSAYSKVGGARPLCYDSDVTQEMVNRYKEELSRNPNSQKF